MLRQHYPPLVKGGPSRRSTPALAVGGAGGWSGQYTRLGCRGGRRSRQDEPAAILRPPCERVVRGGRAYASRLKTARATRPKGRLPPTTAVAIMNSCPADIEAWRFFRRYHDDALLTGGTFASRCHAALRQGVSGNSGPDSPAHHSRLDSCKPLGLVCGEQSSRGCSQRKVDLGHREVVSPREVNP